MGSPGAWPAGMAEDSALKLLAGAARRQAMMLAYNDVFWMMGMCFVLCLPLLLLLGGRHQRPAPVPGKPAVRRSSAREVTPGVKTLAAIPEPSEVNVRS